MRALPLPLALLTGAAWLGHALVTTTGPTYYAPVNSLDYAAVILYTSGLVLLAASLWTVRAGAGRMSAAAASTAAGALFTAGVANLFEDGFGLPLGWLYVAAVLVAIVALLALCVSLVRAGSHLKAILVAVTIVGLFLVSTWLGGAILAATWLAVGVAAHRGRATPSRSPTPPPYR